jgi:hypothetical protein
MKLYSPLAMASPTSTPTWVLRREFGKSPSVGSEGAAIRRLAEQVLSQYVALSELRSAIASSAADFTYRQPEPERSSFVNVVFMPGVIAAPPSYDFD